MVGPSPRQILIPFEIIVAGRNVFADGRRPLIGGQIIVARAVLRRSGKFLRGVKMVAGWRLLPCGMGARHDRGAEERFRVLFRLVAEIDDAALKHFIVALAEPPGTEDAVPVPAEHMLAGKAPLLARQEVMLVICKIDQIFCEIPVLGTVARRIFPGKIICHIPRVDLRIMAEMMFQIPIELDVHLIGIETRVADAAAVVQINDGFHVFQSVRRKIVQFRRAIHQHDKAAVFSAPAAAPVHRDFSVTVAGFFHTDGLRVDLIACPLRNIQNSVFIDIVVRGVLDALLAERVGVRLLQFQCDRPLVVRPLRLQVHRRFVAAVFDRAFLELHRAPGIGMRFCVPSADIQRRNNARGKIHAVLLCRVADDPIGGKRLRGIRIVFTAAAAEEKVVGKLKSAGAVFPPCPANVDQRGFRTVHSLFFAGNSFFRIREQRLRRVLLDTVQRFFIHQDQRLRLVEKSPFALAPDDLFHGGPVAASLSRLRAFFAGAGKAECL